MTDFSFYKYHGAGNDFIIADNRNKQYEALPASFIERLCHRHFGIGADGLILLENAEGYDFRMVYYNSDGYLGSFCGNGSRCITSFAKFLNVFDEKASFIAADGPHEAVLTQTHSQGHNLKVKMRDVSSIRAVGKDWVTDTGSPHYVRFVDSIDAVDIVGEGRAIRNSDEFVKAGINVNFVVVTAEGHLAVYTYERGVEDETLACGTGVTASALVYAHHYGFTGNTVKVITKGGELAVSFDQHDHNYSNVWLEGPAQQVFFGSYKL